MIKAITALVLAVCSLNANCQKKTRFYKVSLAGFSIGELKATTYKKDTLTYFAIESKVSFWMLVRININHSVISAFHNEKLISSTATTHSNKGDFESTTVWEKDHYVVNVNAYKYKRTL